LIESTGGHTILAHPQFNLADHLRDDQALNQTA